MEVGNICGWIGTIVSIITLVLITVASVVPRFVDVYLVSDADQVENSQPVAGIGIFQSFYDSDRVDPQVLEESGVPVDEFTSPSTEFNLLFRAQQNFLVDILPINAETAAALSEAVDDPQLEAFILGLLQPIQDLEFVNCQQYLQDAVNQTTELFDELQNGFVLPGSIDIITNTIADSFNSLIQAVQTLTSANTVVDNPLELLLIGFVTTAATECEVSVDATLDSTAAGCIANTLTGTDVGELTNQVLDFIGSIFVGCEALDLTSFECITQQFDSTFDAVSFFSPQEFSASNNVCTALSNCDGTTLNAQYLGLLAQLLNENAVSDAQFGQLAFGIGIILSGLQLGLNSFTGSNVLDSNFSAFGVDFEIPPTFLDDYDPCEFILAFDFASPIDAINGTCTFANYFAGASVALETAGSDLADLVGDLGLLYGGCAAAEIQAIAGNVIEICPALFANTFVSLGVGFDFTNEVDFFTNGLQECEDEVTDLEKVEQAQSFLIGAYPFYLVSTVAAILAVSLDSSATIPYGIAGAASFLAGILTLSALLTVQSAPIYNAVGQEPDGDAIEPFFVNGPVRILAIMCFLLMLVAGGFLVGASIFSCLEGDSSNDAVEVKAEKQDTFAYTNASENEPAAVETEMVPAKEDPVVADVKTGENVSI